MINQFTLDTISAIATPVGNGGVSIVRISGSKAFAECSKQILYLKPDGTELPINVI